MKIYGHINRQRAVAVQPFVVAVGPQIRQLFADREREIALGDANEDKARASQSQ